MKRYAFLKPGEGVNYDWSQDNTFVKVSTADTGGAFCLMEDNLKRQFALGLHVHRQHAETFYVLEGNVDFYIDGEWMTATPATTVHIPPGIPHAVVLQDGQLGKMLMIFQPSGFDQFLELLASMSPEELNDEKRMEELNERFDIINLGPVPPRG
jgi:quercetin dioxygenase-like cupin family protein